MTDSRASYLTPYLLDGPDEAAAQLAPRRCLWYLRDASPRYPAIGPCNRAVEFIRGPLGSYLACPNCGVLLFADTEAMP